MDQPNDTSFSDATAATDAPVEVLEPGKQQGETSAEALQARVEELEKTVADLKNQNLRLYADYDNLQKRRRQEMEEGRKYAAENTLQSLLPVLDNLERAQNSLNAESEANLLFQSLTLMRQQLSDSLAQVGLTRLNTVGQPFDPSLHEAIARQESADAQEDSVLAETLAGYLLHDRLLRPAQVVVATAAEDNTAAKEVPADTQTLTSASATAVNSPNPFQGA